jgi:murein DD-endopeptidase MepM/ murein hydrolase activator NlpD
LERPRDYGWTTEMTSINNITSLGLGDDPKPKSLASRMQAMFMEVLLKTMEESVEAEGGLFGDSAGSEIYRGLFREQLAAVMSNQLQSPLRKQLEQELTISEGSGSEAPVEGGLVTPAPTLPVNGTVTSGEGWRRDPFNGEMRFHRGTDIAAPVDTAIQAVEGGVVVESGPKGGYGNAVVILSDSGRRTLYGHNKTNLVGVGDRVQAGETIARLGDTGRATGPHVHFEVME